MAEFEERVANGSVTLAEWETLTVERENFEPLRKVISPSKDKRLKHITVFDYFGPKLKTQEYVGAAGFEPAIPIQTAVGRQVLRQIIVTPKVEGADFLRMLEVAYPVKLPALDRPPELKKGYDLRVLLAYLYAAAAEELLSKHLRRSYVIRVNRLNGRVKGKLLLTPYVRESLARARPHVAVCQFYELTPDTLLNRIVRAGLRAARRLVSGAGDGWQEVSGRLSRALSLMARVSDVRVTAADFARVRLHALNRYYEPVLVLARMLIFDNVFEYDVGTPAVRVRGFFLDMNALFERFVAGVFLRWAVDVNYQKRYDDRVSYSRVGEPGGRKWLVVKPDVTCQRDGHTFIVDAKYKEAFEAAERGDDGLEGPKYDYGRASLKPRHADVYQMNTYLDAARLKTGVLLYPSTGRGLAAPYVIEGCGDKKIIVAGFGLKDIDNLVSFETGEWFRQHL